MDATICEEAAVFLGKIDTHVTIQTTHGAANAKPGGCTYHQFENLELWTQSTDVCTFGAGWGFLSLQKMKFMFFEVF